MTISGSPTVSGRESLAEIFPLGRAKAPDSEAENLLAESGSALLSAVYQLLGRFISYPSAHARVAHALWIAHTHLMEAWDSTPRLAFLSAEPASGKTRALEVTELLVPRAIRAVNVTSNYLFRKVGATNGRPTILYDEIDTVFGPKAKNNEDIRALLNAGHRKGAEVGRCVTHHREIRTEEFDAYCAVALAGLGTLPDTILSRSITIRMRRRGPEDSVEPFRRRDEEFDASVLRGRLEAWAAQLLPGMAESRPKMPFGIQDRDADVWEPLLAIADGAGGIWPEMARVACVALVAQSKESSPSLGVRLLSDVRDVFGSQLALTTEEITSGLISIEEAPWAYLSGQPMDARVLANMLKGYEISPKTIRKNGRTPRGYERKQFHDAWQRYLGQQNAQQAKHAQQAAQ